MVLVYLPTKLGDFVRVNVGKYSIHYMEHLGSVIFHPSTGSKVRMIFRPEKGTLRPECIKLIMVCMPPRPAPITCRDHCTKGPEVIEG